MNTRTIYMVCDGDGTMICDGLQEHNARKIAQEWANDLHQSVWLSAHGSEDREEFAPDVEDKR